MTAIILVKPRNPNNIGAAARAMVNFGLNDLRIVNAHPPVLEEAVSAVGAEKILKNAKIFDSLKDALADCNFSFAATSLKNRKTDKEIIFLPDLKLPRGKTAFVFGSEKTGLSAADITLCGAVLNIPAAAAQPSLNLAQAVVLACYEISRQLDFKKSELPPAPQMPTEREIETVSAAAEKYFRDAALPRDILRNARLTRKQLFALKKFLIKL